MKKLFVSCPMAGRKEEDIKKSMTKMHEFMETILEEKLVLIPSYISEDAPEGVNKGAWYLSKSLELMAEADYVVGFGWRVQLLEGHKGCDIEIDVAEAYDIPTYLISDESMAKRILPDLVNKEKVTFYADGIPYCTCEMEVTNE